MTDETTALEPINAYALLSRPTLSLTDRELEIIVADFRRKRHLYLEGKSDAATKAPAKTAAKAAAVPKNEKGKVDTNTMLALMGLGAAK